MNPEIILRQASKADVVSSLTAEMRMTLVRSFRKLFPNHTEPSTCSPMSANDGCLVCNQCLSNYSQLLEMLRAHLKLGQLAELANLTIHTQAMDTVALKEWQAAHNHYVELASFRYVPLFDHVALDFSTYSCGEDMWYIFSDGSILEVVEKSDLTTSHIATKSIEDVSESQIDTSRLVDALKQWKYKYDYSNPKLEIQVDKFLGLNQAV